MICTIPKSKIRKIAIYVNSSKMTMAQIKKALGCQYILNGGLYDMAKFAAINHLTVDGKVLSAGGNPYGYGISGTSLTFSYGNNIGAPTFLGAYPVLVRDGKATGDAAPAGLDGYRQRSCVGVTKAGDVVLLCDQTARSLSGMAAELVKAGCDTAINLDGGGSSQCDFDGQTLAASRIVHNYLCIWTEDVQQAPAGGKKKVLLIAGHGAGDPGAVSTIGSKSYREADEARRVVADLRKRTDCTVYPTDRNAYADYQKGTLRAVAQFQDHDFVLEVHFNAFQAGAADGRVKGVEAYVPKGGDKAVADKLCKAVAACGLTNRGVKEGNLAVINTAKSCGVPACLLEICFLDDPDDMAVYNAQYQQIVRAIASIFGAAEAQPASDAEAARAWVVAQGISDGSAPERAVTRSEVWRMLYRMRR